MKTYGLIGKTLTHSFSNEYFKNKFKNENRNNLAYLNFELNDIDEFPKILENHPELSGLNVTVPYKQSIINYLDETDRDSRFIGAVNTIKIKRRNNKPFLTGYNTDTFGFEKTLLPLLQNHNKKALVLGSGGASKAIKFVLTRNGIPFLEVTRNQYKLRQIRYDMINEVLLKAYNIIINATPVGMFPDVNEVVNIPYEFINQNHLLYDLVYNPEETQFLKLGREKGAVTINGLKMLHLQAEQSWKIWNK
ncbi:MAG: shikimate dehydrogenase [Bacteroidetes bacterium]|nr:shikimate dehydrogenase [Bacteroidota bacterium]